MNTIILGLTFFTIFSRYTLATRGGQYDPSRDGEYSGYRSTNLSQNSAPKDQFAELQTKLKQNAMDAINAIVKRNKLMKEVITLKNNAYGAEAHLRTSSERGQEQLNTLEGQISRLIKTETSKLTKIYLDSNSMILKINRVLVGEYSDDAILAKVQEAKEMLERNKPALEELEKDYEDKVIKFECIRTVAGRMTQFESYYMDNYRLLGGPTESFVNPQITQSSSKAEIILIADTFGAKLSDIMSQIIKNKEGAQSLIYLANEMVEESSPLISPIPKSEGTQVMHGAYDIMENRKNTMEEVLHSINELTESAQLDAAGSNSGIERCIVALANFKNDKIPSDYVRNICENAFRNVKLALTIIKDKKTLLESDYERMNRYFRDIKFFSNMIDIRIGV
ncbi:hypothetical protein BEWA_001100 [Theileria equi strain WA]|uniref:Signal peptide containing protein n=1 Tax=Theileria equi strain WA TaxID=1537102 RepID=L0AZL2_THEEQ|nr:hypothetical protein BEWA_001100 [Theileria equi strain WA]AFZ80703.1 hypothetical protein BEWA_001100 [Theileria equi strain WA]|eukprot:XP_004830369.1 hypothetical protein BEWA_001100 [Theileria equi strain WA]